MKKTTSPHCIPTLWAFLKACKVTKIAILLVCGYGTKTNTICEPLAVKL